MINKIVALYSLFIFLNGNTYVVGPVNGVRKELFMIVMKVVIVFKSYQSYISLHV